MRKRSIALKLIPEDLRKARATLGAGETRANCCPLAQALLRRGLKGVSVLYKRAIFMGAGMGASYALPLAAQKFIERFDAGKRVRPATFRLVEE